MNRYIEWSLANQDNLLAKRCLRLHRLAKNGLYKKTFETILKFDVHPQIQNILNGYKALAKEIMQRGK